MDIKAWSDPWVFDKLFPKQWWAPIDPVTKTAGLAFSVYWRGAEGSSQVHATDYGVSLSKIKNEPESNQTLDLTTSVQEIQGREEHVK